MTDDRAPEAEPTDPNQHGLRGGPVDIDAGTPPLPVRRGWRAGVVVVVVVVAIALLTQPAVRRQLMLSISRRPTPFSELSFTDYADLPKALPAGGAEAISFTVANHTSTAQDYQVAVTAQTAGAATTVATMRVAVANRASVARSAEFLPPAPGTYEIVVQLVGIEEIHYTVVAS